jgi:hypothetical protein
MGCACSRDDNVDQEEKLINAESQLPYIGISSKQIITQFQRMADDRSKFSAQVWESIVEQLTHDAPLTSVDFYENFKNPDGSYPAITLTILGLLLSKGTSSDRSVHIFSVFDREKVKKISYEALFELISTMMEVAIDKLPLLSSSMKPNTKLFEYVAKLKGYKTKAINHIARLFNKRSGDFITELEFQSLLSSDEHESLLRPSGLRKKTLQIGDSSQIS